MHMLAPGAPMDSSPTTPQMCIHQQYQFCVLSTWLPMQVASFSFPGCLDLLQGAFIQYDLVSMAHF